MQQGQGAIIVLQYPASQETVYVGRQTIKYIERHHRDWTAFAASGEDYDQLRGDIIFVSGCVKTGPSWSMAVIGSDPSNNMSMAQRHWPGEQNVEGAPPSLTFDHCIFLRYHKAMHRVRNDGNSGPTEHTEVRKLYARFLRRPRELLMRFQKHDPLDHILDYILEVGLI